MSSILKHGAGALFIALVLALPTASPAFAATPSTPCWQLVMNQWYQGAITTVFPIDCYQQAIQHLPTDIQVYSSARDDITRARNAAIAYNQQQAAAAAAAGSATTTNTAKLIKQPIIKTHGPGSGLKASAPDILNSASPGGATSFPLPLLILGGLAILLVAAGGIGLFVRRLQGRGPASS